MQYGYRKQAGLSFQETLARTKTELAKVGFGILTEIDARETLRNKLGQDMENYVILGACNPNLAYEALSAEKEIGLMLPCNVIVYEEDGKVYVSAVLPTAMMSSDKNIVLARIAKTAEEKLKRSVDNVAKITV